MTSPSTTEPRAADSTGFATFKPRILHTSYHVADIDRALAFYVGVLGMKEQLRLDLSKTLHEVVLGFPDGKGAGVILMWDTARTTPLQIGDGYSRFVLNVSDIDAATAHLRERGTRITVPPTDAGPMRYSMVLDPDGYTIELLQLKRS
jgi:lactoylglutathione lyase